MRSEAVAQQRLAMHKIKDILRLHLLGGVTSCRRIGRADGVLRDERGEILAKGSTTCLVSRPSG